MDRYEGELLAGHCLVVVRTKGAERRHRALDIVKPHRGHCINLFTVGDRDVAHLTQASSRRRASRSPMSPVAPAIATGIIDARCQRRACGRDADSNDVVHVTG